MEGSLRKDLKGLSYKEWLVMFAGNQRVSGVTNLKEKLCATNVKGGLRELPNLCVKCGSPITGKTLPAKYCLNCLPKHSPGNPTERRIREAAKLWAMEKKIEVVDFEQ